MRWFGHKTTVVDDESGEFILPDHVCRIPQSRAFGGGIRRVPDDPDKQPVGTQWICECGKAWVVEPELATWERCPAMDVTT